MKNKNGKKKKCIKWKRKKEGQSNKSEKFESENLKAS